MTYQLCYCYYGNYNTIAFFDNYQDGKRAKELLEKEYPDSKIVYSPVVPMCFDAFMDETGGKIEAYERHKKNKEIFD